MKQHSAAAEHKPPGEPVHLAAVSGKDKLCPQRAVHRRALQLPRKRCLLGFTEQEMQPAALCVWARQHLRNPVLTLTVLPVVLSDAQSGERCLGKAIKNPSHASIPRPCRSACPSKLTRSETYRRHK